jgi:hypothetical protein
MSAANFTRLVPRNRLLGNWLFAARPHFEKQTSPHLAYNRLNWGSSAGISEVQPDDQNPLHPYRLRTKSLSEFNFSRVNQLGVRVAIFGANACTIAGA